MTAVFSSKGGCGASFIAANGIGEFYLAGADAVACVKSTCYNMRKAGYDVTVLSDCITSYDTTKIDEMLRYYEAQGSRIMRLADIIASR